MKKISLFLVFALLMNYAFSQSVNLTLNCGEKGISISPTLYGVFFEDINFAADGGLYAELIRNRSFEDNIRTLAHWSLVSKASSVGAMSLDTTTQMLNTAQTRALKLNVSSVSKEGRVGIMNEGFWGINVVKGRQYQLTFFAKSDKFKGTITASLEDSTNAITYASTSVSNLGKNWKKYTCTLTANAHNPKGRFVLSTQGTGTIWFDVVSLFPPTYKNRPNGLRSDLVELVQKMAPKFVRFPGGCFVEGDSLYKRFQWKTTIGAIETRAGHKNIWKYRTSDGMGMHEFLLLCEDLNAAPLYVVNVGLSHKDKVEYNKLEWYIQDMLDALEYANGDVNTKYGAMRAANGHPKPFNIKYVEIGNENNQPTGIWGDHYYERYIQFYNVIKAKYPDIQCIGNVVAWGNDNPKWGSTLPVDLLDEHYYRTWTWFTNQYNKYDTYDRKGAKIYAGEYAVTIEGGKGRLHNAIGEAVYMLGMERNSDIVTMSSYAPMFANVNQTQWNPNAMYYNSATSYGTPSYHVQCMFANNIGDVDVPMKDENNVVKTEAKGAFGLGAWETNVSYDNLQVLDNKGKVLFSDNMDTDSQWKTEKGTWNANGTLNQTAITQGCQILTKFSTNEAVYSYKVKALKNSGKEGFMIVFGYQDAKNYYTLNLGGWANSKHGLEKNIDNSRTLVASVAGSIKDGQSYEVRIDVNGSLISCYLDNTLLFTYKNEDRSLYYSCSKDTKTNDLFLKVVNVSKEDKASDINIKGMTDNLSFKGTATVLTSENGTDENTITNPNLVSPKISDITTTTNFKYTFPKKSVTVFKLQPEAKK